MKHNSYTTSGIVGLMLAFVCYEGWQMLATVMPFVILLLGIVIFSSVAVYVPMLLFAKWHGLWFIEHQKPRLPRRD